MRKLYLDAGTATDIGTRKSNQDRCLTRFAPDATGGMFCVADGMGGHSMGELAAQIAVDAADAWYKSLALSDALAQPDVCETLLRELVFDVNTKLREEGAAHNSTIGTTFSMLLIAGGKYYVAHAGDSVVCRLAAGRFGRHRQLTEDHVSIDATGRAVLTSCLGVYGQPFVQCISGSINKPCAFVLCTDGVSKVLKVRAIARAVLTGGNCAESAAAVVGAVRQQGIKDNATVVVVGAFSEMRTLADDGAVWADFDATMP